MEAEGDDQRDGWDDADADLLDLDLPRLQDSGQEGPVQDEGSVGEHKEAEDLSVFQQVNGLADVPDCKPATADPEPGDSAAQQLGFGLRDALIEVCPCLTSWTACPRICDT